MNATIEYKDGRTETLPVKEILADGHHCDIGTKKKVTRPEEPDRKVDGFIIYAKDIRLVSIQYD